MRTCRTCGETKPLTAFHLTGYKDKRYLQCTECRNDAANGKYRRRTELLGRFKMSKGCACCGFDRSAAALDWHHIDMSDKEFYIRDSLKMRIVTLFKELRKCVVLCANCHRMVHAGDIALASP